MAVARKKAEEVESKAFQECEEVKKSMEKAEAGLKHKEELANQAMERCNKVNNALQEARNNFKLAEIQHRKELDEPKKQMETELKQQVKVAKNEAIEAYKSSQAFKDTVIEAAMPGVDMGMSYYQVGLKKSYSDLDLTSLDKQFPKSLPIEEPEASELFSPTVEVVASLEIPIEDLIEQITKQLAVEDLPPPPPPKANQAEVAQTENPE